MASTKSINVDPEIVSKTQCDMHYACLSDKSACDVEPFVDRELQLLRCNEPRSCAYKRKYQGRFICSCPVNRAAHGYN